MPRVREADLVVPALGLMRAAGGFISTSDLIDQLDVYFQPTGVDAAILDGRSDTYFSQKVRNLVSHRDGGRGLEARGLATYDATRKGWRITQTGSDFLDTADASS